MHIHKPSISFSNPFRRRTSSTTTTTTISSDTSTSRSPSISSPYGSPPTTTTPPRPLLPSPSGSSKSQQTPHYPPSHSALSSNPPTDLDISHAHRHRALSAIEAGRKDSFEEDESPRAIQVRRATIRNAEEEMEMLEKRKGRVLGQGEWEAEWVAWWGGRQE